MAQTSWLKTFVVLTVVDAVYLSLAARALYTPSIGDVLAPKTNWVAAMATWAVIAFALKSFVLDEAENPQEAYRKAALLGFVIYASYNLTNMATLKQWPWAMALIDTLWGMVLAVIVTFALY